MEQIFSDRSVKVFSIGEFKPATISDLRSGEWKNFFRAIPGDDEVSTMSTLVPIAFKLRDFRMRPVKVSNILQYNQVVCDVKSTRTITIYLDGVWKWG